MQHSQNINEFIDLHTEQKLLGSLWVDGDLFYSCKVTKDHFSDPIHKEIFSIMNDQYLSKRNFDAVDQLLKDQHHRMYYFDKVIGNYGDFDICQQMVLTNALKREVKNTCKLLPNMITDCDLNSTLNIVQSSFMDIVSSDTTKEANRISKASFEALDYMDRLDAGQIEHGIKTGISELDRKIGGFAKETLTTIAAPSQHGKTALALSFMLNQAQANVKVGFFSLEMSEQQIVFRLGAMNTCLYDIKVPANKVTKGLADDKEKESFRRSLMDVGNLDIYINDDPTLDIHQIDRMASKMKAVYDIDILYVDYIQLIKADPKVNREQQVKQSVEGLKNIAKKLSIPVVGMAQVNRVSQENPQMPRIHQIRESSTIEHTSDNVIMMWRPKIVKIKDDNITLNDAELLIDKARDGSRGALELHFNDELTLFSNKVKDNFPF